MLGLTVLGVCLDVLVPYSMNGLFTALQELSSTAFECFLYFLAVFSVLAMAAVVHMMMEQFINQTFIIQWRTWPNDHMVGDWLDGRAYHRGQRIQEDITSFVTDSQLLWMG